MDNNDSFLSNFGGIANNSLFYFINPIYHKSIVNDAELNPVQECHYYSDSNQLKYYQNNQTCSPS